MWLWVVVGVVGGCSALWLVSARMSCGLGGNCALTKRSLKFLVVVWLGDYYVIVA